MEQPHEKDKSPSIDQFNRDSLKLSLENLKTENSRLKDLVIRLSETLIRTVMGRK
jgi:hypothetical protein